MSETQVSTILLATDLSSRCEHALARAVALANLWDAQLHVLTVLSPAELMDDDDLADGVLAARTQRRVEDSLAGRRQAKVHILFGSTDESIAELAADIDADLIVTGPSGSGWLVQSLLGGTLLRLMRRAHVPVLLVRTPASRPYRNVVAAVDLSDASRASIDAATAIFGARIALSVFHAFHTPYRVFSGDIDAYESGVREGLTLAIRETLEAWSIENADTIPTIAQYGDPATALAEIVDRHDIQLVTAGTHGRSGLLHLVLGSVAEQIAETVNCDVLVAPSRGAWGS